MNLIFGVPCYGRYDRLHRLLQTIEQGTRKPDTYMIVDNGMKISQAIISGIFRAPEETHTHTYHAPERLNEAESWNTVLRHYEHDLVILVRDEAVHVERDTVEKLVRASEASKDLRICMNREIRIQKPELLQTVGYYHERFAELILSKVENVNVPVELTHPGELVPPALADAIFSKTITVK